MTRPVTLDHLLAGMPQPPPVEATAVAALARESGQVLVVLDDDPTGTQSVHDLPVVLDRSVASLTWALRQGTPAVYVMTNSRSLAPVDAERCTRDVARAALAAAADVGVEIGFVSRSDSTLRGHFPLEPLTLVEEVERATGRPVDGIVVVPAFPDAGRVTVDAVHYAGSPADGYVPVGETEFARDATFGYRSSDLRQWVEEKSGGRIPAAGVAHIGLATLRGETDSDSDGEGGAEINADIDITAGADPGAALAVLTSPTGAQPVICDIAEEGDLRRLAISLYAAQAAGRTFVHRVGPPFVRAMIGQEPREPLQPNEIHEIGRGRPSPDTRGGLVVIGSHVSMTTRQLDELVTRDRPAVVELDVATVTTGDTAEAEQHVAHVAAQAVGALSRGTVVVHTSRALTRAADPDASLDIARRVSAAVVDVVRQVVAARLPRFVVAKGGITASDVATHGLSVTRAVARGPMLPGIVSLWEPMDGPARGIPYVVFPGNVGGPSALADVVHTLST